MRPKSSQIGQQCENSHQKIKAIEIWDDLSIGHKYFLLTWDRHNNNGFYLTGSDEVGLVGLGSFKSNISY